MVSVFDAGPIPPAPCILNSRGLGRRPQTNHTFQVPNTAEGHRALLARLTGLAPALVVLEASGGYEAAVASTLYEAGLPVVVVNPRRVRAFAQAQGRLAKTDRIDATVVADFGRVLNPPVRPLPPPQAIILNAMLRDQKAWNPTPQTP